MPKCIFTNHGSSNGLTLLSISVTTPPNKTAYLAGDTFDPTGMVVTASYGIHSTVVTETPINGYIITPNPLTDGTTNVTITYSEGGQIYTTTTPVQVTHKLQSIEVTTLPNKTTYEYSDTLDTTGMVITTTYSDNANTIITDYTCNPTILNQVNNNFEITVSYSENGVTKTTSFNVIVDRKSVAKPTWNDNNKLFYTGSPYFVGDPTLWINFNPDAMTIGGTTSATDAGTYEVIFTLNDNYKWDDGTTDPIAVSWTINKVEGSFTLSTTSVSLDGSNYSTGVQVTVTDATGTITAVSSNNTAVPVIVNGNTITIKGDGSTAGNFAITVKCAESTNYTAPADQTITVNVEYWSWGDENAIADETWWKGLSFYMGDGGGAEVAVGKTKKVTLTSTVLGTTTHTVRCIGINQDGDNTVTFQTTTCMKDFTAFGSNAVWIGSTARAKCQEYYNAFPGKSYVKTVKKGTCPSMDSSRNASVTYNDETVFLLSEREFGLDKYAPISTANSTTTKAECTQGYNAPYSYYNSNNRRIFYKDNGSGSASSDYGYPWERSRFYDFPNFVCYVNVNGSADNNGYSSSYGFAPAFVIGPPPPPPKIYGVEWDWTSNGPTKGVRTDDAVLFADPSPAVNNDTGSSPFDNLYPWNGMTVETRTGGVMVKEPKYWFKWTKTGKKLKLQIADGPVDGFHVDPVNMDKGDGLGELDFSYIGRYHCVSDNWKSETNKAQKTSITRSDARTNIHSLGTNIWQMDFAQMWYVNMLFLVEFADWNGERIGRGCSASGSKENNGKTDAMKYHTGTTAANRDTYGFTQYRNIEGWWDNVFDWMDGCYYTSSGLNVILNPNKFSDSANGTLIGFMPSSGYPNDMAIPTQSGFEWALRPASTGGSTTTYVPDRWNFGSGPCLCHGGSYSQGPNYGPFYVYCGSASDTDDYIGCRLQERPPKAA